MSLLLMGETAIKPAKSQCRNERRGRGEKQKNKISRGLQTGGMFGPGFTLSLITSEQTGRVRKLPQLSERGRQRIRCRFQTKISASVLTSGDFVHDKSGQIQMCLLTNSTLGLERVKKVKEKRMQARALRYSEPETLLLLCFDRKFPNLNASAPRNGRERSRMDVATRKRRG